MSREKLLTRTKHEQKLTEHELFWTQMNPVRKHFLNGVNADKIRIYTKLSSKYCVSS